MLDQTNAPVTVIPLGEVIFLAAHPTRNTPDLTAILCSPPVDFTPELMERLYTLTEEVVARLTAQGIIPAPLAPDLSVADLMGRDHG
jgi:hypothetical protein